MSGSTLNQDFNLIRPFFSSKEILPKIYQVTTSALVTMTNQLNAMFMKPTSMTCLAFLLQIRLELAKIMLAETT